MAEQSESAVPGGYALVAKKLYHGSAWQNRAARDILFWLIGNVTHKTKYVGSLKIERGQVLIDGPVSRHFQKVLSWKRGRRSETYSKDAINRAMRLLHNDRTVTASLTASMTASQSTILTLCNYDKYQDPKAYDRTADRIVTASRPHRAKNLNIDEIVEILGEKLQSNNLPNERKNTIESLLRELSSLVSVKDNKDIIPTASGDAVGRKRKTKQQLRQECMEAGGYLTKKGRCMKGNRLAKFNEFWQAFGYPKGKAEAADAWLDIDWTNNAEHNRKLFECIIAAAESEAQERQQLLRQGKTPKMAQGWISGRRWEDQPCRTQEVGPQYERL